MTKETIGRYEIQSEIGRGGMATVYLAYDPNFRRNVAIKLVSVNLHENKIFRERFEREARLIARIEHPAIVPVYDFGEQSDQPYLVMRYMPGGSLAAKVKEGITFSTAVQMISQIAPALDAVHAQAVVHRDLKPGNILFDGFGNPAISDFGIAYLTAATNDLTGSAIIGTPTYMSPEQVRGDDNLDGRSDIYALGVILFEMLAGRGPFYAANPLSIAMKHLTDSIPSIRSFRPDLPEEVELALNKAMAKDREARYANASELARALREVPAFQESGIRVSSPVSHRQELSTEVDVSGNSQASIDSSSAPRSENIQSNVKHSQKISDEKILSSASAKNVKPSRSRMPQIFAIAGVGLILFFLCGSLGVFGTWAGLSNLFSGGNPTVIPTFTKTSDTLQDVVLFSDDFANPQSGWPNLQNSQGAYSYQVDGYHISVQETGAVLWAKTDRQDDDASIYVDATPVTESVNGYYGLLCRIEDDRNFYYFVIQSNGNYNIGKYKNGEFVPLLSADWRQSDAIRQGSQTNRLKADCSGNILRFYVNNVLLGEVTDADFASGSSGIVVAALDAQGFEVRFNSFLITQPGQ